MSGKSPLSNQYLQGSTNVIIKRKKLRSRQIIKKQEIKTIYTLFRNVSAALIVLRLIP